MGRKWSYLGTWKGIIFQCRITGTFSEMFWTHFLCLVCAESRYSSLYCLYQGVIDFRYVFIQCSDHQWKDETGVYTCLSIGMGPSFFCRYEITQRKRCQVKFRGHVFKGSNATDGIPQGHSSHILPSLLDKADLHIIKHIWSWLNTNYLPLRYSGEMQSKVN